MKLIVVCEVELGNEHESNCSAKVWFQEKADIGKVLDLTDLEDLTDEFVQNQLLR
jgi:hypothetical protein